jgi:TetR/AcrR family fatty acid metabolism transcriptional regulator
MSSVSNSPTTPLEAGNPATRERLLHAALACFSRKGYHQTTTDEIVTESGMGKGTLYRYFETKQDLFISLIDWFMLEFDEEIAHSWSEGMPAADRIRAMVNVFLQESEQLIPFFKITVDFWAQSMESDRLQRMFWKWLRRYQKQLAGVIKEGVARGEFRPVQAEQVALGLFATLDALALYRSLMGSDIDLPGTVNASLEVFLAGLQQQEGDNVA